MSNDQQSESLAWFWVEKLRDEARTIGKSTRIFVISLPPSPLNVGEQQIVYLDAQSYLADHRVCARALAVAESEAKRLDSVDLWGSIQQFMEDAWGHPAESMRDLALALGWADQSEAEARR